MIPSPLPGPLLKNAPYRDDFDPAKKFSQIAHNSSVAVQGRELTQAQTILQEQIGRLGQSIYQNGSTVIGASTTISRSDGVSSRKLNLTAGIVFYNYRFLLVCNTDNEIGQYTIDLGNGTSNFYQSVESQLSVTLGEDDTTVTLSDASNFPDNGVIQIDNEFILYETKIDNVLQDITRGYLDTVPVSHIETSNVLLLQRRDGFKKDDTPFTFTFNGSSKDLYIENPTTDLEYGTWFNSNNFQAGFKIIEGMKTVSDDSSLYSPASGTPNENARGADRLFIDLILDIRPLNQEYNDFIYSVRFKNGSIVEEKVEPQYSEILNEFARTTSETQGNFSVNPHTMSVLEWSTRELEADPSREDTFALNISSGKTYVNGFRREKLAPTKLKLDKGFQNISENLPNQSLSFLAYDYFTVNLTTSGPIQVNKLMSLTINVSGPQTYYSWVRQVDKIGETEYRIYFSDTNFSFTSNFSDGVSLSFYDSEDPSVPGAPVAEGNSTSEIFFNDGKSLNYLKVKDAVNYTDLSSYTKVYQTSQIPGGTSTFTLDNNLPGETDPSDASQYALTSTIPGNKVYVIDTAGNSYTTGFVLTNTGVNQINWTNTPPINDYHVYYEALETSNTGFSTETTELRNTNVVVNMLAPTPGKETLNVDQFIGGGTTPGYYDVFSINSIVDNDGNTYTENVNFSLLTGQTSEYFYGSGIRWIRNRPRPTVGYTIDFNYWDHQGTSSTESSGSLITADSFVTSDGSSKDYLNISDYQKSKRSDFIDFRTRNDQVFLINDVYTIGDSSQNGIDIRKRSRRPITNDNFTFDVQRYLPRYDTLYINKDGKFILESGVPRVSPQKVKSPDNSLLLGYFYIPAYPRSRNAITIEKWDSSRYRQEDIKRLEYRISNLESFVLRNKLELLALNRKDQEGDIKKGILVDDFSGHGVSNVNHPEYSASIDPFENALRLPYVYQYHDLDLNNVDDIGSNILVTDKTVMLNFTESLYLQNNKASSTVNVNPYDVFEWRGNLKLTPAVDTWVNTDVQPDIIDDRNLANSNFDESVKVSGFDREYNSWLTRIKGVPKDVLSSSERFKPAASITITDEQVIGSSTTIEQPDYVEQELRSSPRATNLKLTGFQEDLT